MDRAVVTARTGGRANRLVNDRIRKFRAIKADIAQDSRGKAAREKTYSPDLAVH